MLDFPSNDCIANNADAMSIRDHHRPVEKSGIFDPSCSGHFAIAVEAEPSGEDGVVGIFSPRQNGGYAGANRPHPDLQRALPRNQGSMADFHALDVGDSVQRAGITVEGNTEITSA